jgi:hypothetical protein
VPLKRTAASGEASPLAAVRRTPFGNLGRLRAAGCSSNPDCSTFASLAADTVHTQNSGIPHSHGCAMHGSVRLTPPARAARLLVLAVLLTAGTGCTRKFFRQRADDDVAGVLTQKNVFPNWKIENWHVYPDPRARYADTGNPDRPPFQPDDYAARVLSPNPQRPTKKDGVGRYEGTGYLDILAEWDEMNRASEPPPEPRKDGAPAPAPERLPEPKPIPKVGDGARSRSLVSRAELLVAARGAGELRPRPGPVVTPDRDSRLILAVGEVEQEGKTVPAVALLQAPDKLPNLPVPPGPRAPDDPEVLIATGDEATRFLRALTGNQAGFRIKLDQAVELGVLNAREFQDRREDLYLAALPVTLQRFNFAAQAFLTETSIRESIGKEAPGGPANFWQFNTTGGFSKLFPTGALLMVKLANQFVVNLGHGNPNTAVSNVSLSLAQPLLRGGGFAVTLEPLTLVERNLLYAIRSYARFRKIFYVAIGAGGGYTNNPYGLQGLGSNLGRGIGANLTAPTIGYLPLLLQAAIIANQRKNIESLEGLLHLYEAFREGGQQSDLQVGQVEIQLLNSRTQLLGSTASNTGGGAGGGGGIRGYLDNLDNFKLQLGVPITTGINLDDSPLKPVREQLARFEAVYAEVRDLENTARAYNPADPVNRFRPRWRQILTDAPLVRGTQFSRNILARWASWESLNEDQLNQRMAALAEERRKILDRKADRLSKGQPEPEAELRRLAELEADLELGQFEQAVRRYEAQPWLKEKGAVAGTVQAAAFRDVFNTFYQLILEGRNERLAEIRGRWPKLPPVLVDGADILDVPLDDAYTTGIQAALSYRLDLMNTRGQVVDLWRTIAVQANSLQGVLGVQYNLNSTTPPARANPLAFSGDRTTSTLTFNGELPLVRRAERNAYRAALIGYQRQRRTLQAFEDNIANDVRADIRELRTIAELYKVQQRLIELGYSQVDNAQAILLAPPAPGAASDAGGAAALTLQVLNAQSNLLQTQNTLYTIWVNFLISRMTFYLDLELMQLDERGLWCEESVPPSDPGRPDPARPDGERLPAPRAVPGADPGRRQ